MKTRNFIAASIAVLSATLIAPAFAQGTNTPNIDKRQANQAARIEQGKASGELNAKEAARLDAGQARVVAKEEKAKADGVVTKKERAKLQHAENKQSRKIHRQKHDRQKAPTAAPVSN
ncbi:MAG: hypothetical protein ABL931_09525 [Usitatibacteraceae bacterium]